VYARQRGPAYTGSVVRPAAGKRGKPPVAVPGEDGEIDFENGDELVTGSIGAPAALQTVVSAPGEISGNDAELAAKPRQSVGRVNLPTQDRINLH